MSKIPIEKLWNNSNEYDWKKALESYRSQIKPEHLIIEEDIIRNNIISIEKMTPKEWFDFLLNKYFKWKYTQANRYASTTKYLKKYKEENRLDELQSIKLQFLSVEKANIKESLKLLSQIKGLGIAGASGLLALLYPKIYGVVDQFVVNGLIKTKEFPELKLIEPENITLNQGVHIIKILQQKAEELNKKFKTNFWTPRKIDMILWGSRG